MMEQLSSSSKVTVEYFDPFGVYRLLSPSLLQRLPLHNLHWESHSGPLRSIDTLHIDLFQSHETVTEAISTNPTKHRSTESEDSIITGDDGYRNHISGQGLQRPESRSGPIKAPVKERRHQIPGLRQTPYLKIFLFRCDDIDTYRAQGRRQIKQWIKEHTPPAQISSKVSTQENYDAFEWLIIHVVLPNTPAANQPRVNGKHSEGNSGLVSEKSGPRWRGGNSSTIYEKLKADFNGSSKSSVDRIAQIRIGINDTNHGMVPQVAPMTPRPYIESPQENELAWQDLISKLKSLILASFDMRVSQYEEDIREKDAQRSLPGWNFCTFFVLKEGLARGYESVGLIEDSLVEYDELSVGLDMIIRDQIAKNRPEHGGTFLPFTEDFKIEVQLAVSNIAKDMGISDIGNFEIQKEAVSSPSSNGASKIPLDATKKRYRELILANNISVFDFRCYLFARQLELLSRLANASFSKEELLLKLEGKLELSLQGLAARKPIIKTWDQNENLVVLSKICRRAMEFISSISCIMRNDLWLAYHQSKDSSEKGTSQTKINQILLQASDNIVSSFTFSAAQQILAQTSTKSLPIPPSILTPIQRVDKKESNPSNSESKSSTHPTRSSSLAIRSQKKQSTDQSISPRGRRASVPDHGSASTSLFKMGLEELAAHRAELYLFSRSILQRAGAQRGWSVGWSEMANYQADYLGELENIDLTEDSTKHSSNPPEELHVPPSCHGIKSELLRNSLRSKDDFYRLYEKLSDKALRHYTLANRHHSVQSSMADLAVLKYHLKDYSSAASYLNRMVSFYGEAGWSNVELLMLVIYAKCLQQLKRKDEYVRVIINLLSRIAIIENERFKRKLSKYWKKKVIFEDCALVKERYLKELSLITRTLTHQTNIPLQNFFGWVEVDETIRYHPKMDSFELQIRLLYLLDDELEVEKVRVRISSVINDTSRDIWIETTNSLVFKKGINEVFVPSNTTIPGIYFVKCIILTGNNIIHSYDQDLIDVTVEKNLFLRCPGLLIYQRPEAFDIKLHSSRFMHLGRNRSLEIELSSGWNNVINGEIRIRAATAGLRLQTSETKVVFGSITLKNQDAGIICFNSIQSRSFITIAIPFSLEQEVPEISIKLELSYTTEKGTFSYAITPSISTAFPLGVNVQDFFKQKSLFSKFTISSATSIPLRLVESKLYGSEIFKVHCGPEMKTPLVVYPRLSATIVYQITKIKSKPNIFDIRKKNRALSLVLKFTCIEEEVIATITSDLLEKLKDSFLNPYSRLVIAIVVCELQKCLSSQDFERAALLGETPISRLATVDWREHFKGLGRCSEGEVASLITEFLQKWQGRRSIIPLNFLSTKEAFSSKIRSITIPVDIPSMTVVNTTDIQLVAPSMQHYVAARVVLYQPFAASLKIEWTKIWDLDIHLGKKISGENYHEFSYEVCGPSDTWIIGGRRKGIFKVPKTSEPQESSEPLILPIILIPLRQGLLPFPTIDIKVASVPRAKSPNLQAHISIPSEPIISCETDHKNAAEFIQVVSDASALIPV